MAAWVPMRSRPLVVRLVTVSILALGLVGMHHLVATQCHHATSMSTSGFISTSESAATLRHEPSTHQPDAEAGLQARMQATWPAAPIALCLAILILVMQAFGPLLRSRGPGTWAWDFQPRARADCAERRKPCLFMLSISRT